MSDFDLRQKAVDLTRNAIVIDAYNCAGGRRIQEPTGWFNKKGSTQVDLVKAKEGGLTAAGFSMGDGIRSPKAVREDSIIKEAVKSEKMDWWDFPWPPDDGRPYTITDWHRSNVVDAMMGMEIYLREITLAAENAILITEGRQIRQAAEEGKIGVILHGNTVTMFEDSVEMLHVYHRLGLRMIILARAGRNLICDGYKETRANSKLTTFGVRVVHEMNKLGMIVDASHMSESCFYDLLEVSEKPVICSHSNSKALCPFPRNLTDDQVKALVQTGGMVGLTYVPHFIDLDAPREYRDYTPESPLFQRWVDHCDHYLDLVGPDHIGLGSDFDGGGNLLKDMSQLPYVTEALLGRGYQEDVIRKILGENWLRLFETQVF